MVAHVRLPLLGATALSKSRLRYIGLVVPPVAWALSTQLGQITPYVDCRQTASWTAAFCGILLAVSIAGVFASRAASTGLVRYERFIVDTSFLIALAFVFALSLQEAAAVLLDPCQR
jgi:hypothetical protein